jgi:hypothetical protein
MFSEDEEERKNKRENGDDLCFWVMHGIFTKVK